MRSDPLCPACTQVGRLLGEDERGREFFACLTAGCEVVEYDREIIRHREGWASVPPVRALRSTRGLPPSETRAR